MRALVRLGRSSNARKQVATSMGIDRAWRPLGAFGRPGSPARVANAINRYGGPEGSSLVFACTSVIAETLSGYPWALQDRRDNDVERSRANEEIHALLDEPWNGGTYPDFVQDVGTDLCLVGNSYWLKDNQNALGQPESLERLVPGLVRVVTDNRDRKVGYVYRLNGIDIPFNLNDVIHYRFRNPLHKHYGMGIVEAIWREIEQDYAEGTHITSFFHNGARIAGVMTVPEGMDDTQFERLKTQVMEEYGGAENAYHILIGERATDFKPIQAAPEHTGVVDLSKLSEDRILMGFGVGKFMLGGREEGGMPKMEQTQFIFYRRMLPRARLFQDRTSLDLVSRWNYKFVVKPELAEPPSIKVQNARGLGEAGATMNEMRKAAGLPEIEDERMNVPLVPVQVQPLAVAYQLDPVPESQQDPDNPQPANPPLLNRAWEPFPKAPNGSALPPPPGEIRQLAAGVIDEPPDAVVVVETPELPRRYEERDRTIEVGAATDYHAREILEGQARFLIRHTQSAQSRFVNFFNDQRMRIIEAMLSGDFTSAAPRRAANVSTKEPLSIEAVWNDDDELSALLGVFLPLLDELGAEAIITPNAITGATGAWDVANPRVARFRGDLALHVVDINDTTRKAVSEQIEEGMRRGYSIPRIANGYPREGFPGIQGVFNTATVDRAERTAHAEVARIFNAASIASYQEGGVGRVQVYDGSGDSKCAAASGAIWGVDQAAEELLGHPFCVRAFAPIL